MFIVLDADLLNFAVSYDRYLANQSVAVIYRTILQVLYLALAKILLRLASAWMQTTVRFLRLTRPDTEPRSSQGQIRQDYQNEDKELVQESTSCHTIASRTSDYMRCLKIWRRPL
jgi:hypothetical protein